jgi:folate-binding protein YgfZ
MSRPTTVRGAYICSHCLTKSSRPFSTIPKRQLAAPVTLPLSSYAKLTNRRLISLSGVDAPKFLQGLTTNNVDPTKDEAWYTAFLNAQGRLLWDAFVYPRGNESERQYLIEVDGQDIEGFTKHLKRHKLRSKVKIENVSEEWGVYASWKDMSLVSTSSSPIESNSTTNIVLPDPRLPGFSTRILLHGQNISSSAYPEPFRDISKMPLSTYTIHRYLYGIPEGPSEIIPITALPQESNFDHLNGIDFRKGCYLGQELTIRTQHTGVVRKRILPVSLYPTGASPPTKLEYDPDIELVLPPSGSDIKAEGGRRAAGKFLAGIGNIGLALCRLEHMTDLKVTDEGGSFREGIEFGIDEGVKVKAFVPQWLRDAERQKADRRKKILFDE